MSVVKGEREETKLTVVEQAEELAGYTLKMATNEKRFPKRYRWCFTSKLCDMALELTELVHEANGIFAKDKSEMRLRLRYELMAIAKVNGLLNLISVGAKVYGISLDNIEYWLDKTTYERTLLIKWRESDRERLGGLPD